MKRILVLALFFVFTGAVQAQQPGLRSTPDSTKKLYTVEAPCGECQFKMEGKGCHLAIRMNGRSYFVDGTSIDEHGDAHAKNGFCESVRKANVQGEVVEGRFKARYFKVLKPVTRKDTLEPVQ